MKVYETRAAVEALAREYDSRYIWASTFLMADWDEVEIEVGVDGAAFHVRIGPDLIAVLGDTDEGWLAKPDEESTGWACCLMDNEGDFVIVDGDVIFVSGYNKPEDALKAAVSVMIESNAADVDLYGYVTFDNNRLTGRFARRFTYRSDATADALRDAAYDAAETSPYWTEDHGVTNWRTANLRYTTGGLARRS